MSCWWCSLKSQFRGLYNRVNRVKWVPYLRADGGEWHQIYNSQGLPTAHVIKYEIKTVDGITVDPYLELDGDFESACSRRTVRKTVAPWRVAVKP